MIAVRNCFRKTLIREVRTISLRVATAHRMPQENMTGKRFDKHAYMTLAKTQTQANHTDGNVFHLVCGCKSELRIHENEHASLLQRLSCMDPTARASELRHAE